MKSAAYLLSTAVLLGAQDPTAEGARKFVQDFYAAHFREPMGFDEKSLLAKERFLAPDLYRALVLKSREGAGNPDEVPDIDGDPFTDSQEYPDAFKVGKAQASGGSVRVQVRLTWKAGNPPRSLTAVVKNGPRGWRLEDIRYGDGPTLRDRSRPGPSLLDSPK